MGMVLILLLLVGLGFGCKGSSNPTSANGTPVPGYGGY